MAEDDEKDEFDLNKIFVGGATWGGKANPGKSNKTATSAEEPWMRPALDLTAQVPEPSAVAAKAPATQAVEATPMPVAPPTAEPAIPWRPASSAPATEEVPAPLPAIPTSAPVAPRAAPWRPPSATPSPLPEALPSAIPVSVPPPAVSEPKPPAPTDQTAIGSGEEAGRQRGLLKRGGSGSSFVLKPEVEEVKKPRRKLFPRETKLKVDKQQGKAGPSTVVDSRVIRGRAAKMSRLRSPLNQYHMTVVSGSGGVGKTTAAAMLAWLLAEARDSGVVILESIPGGGGLAHRFGIDLEVSSADVFRIAEYARGLEDVQTQTQKFGKLEVVGTSEAPRVSDILDLDEHEKVLELLRRYYSIVITDTEAGLLSPRTTVALESADQIVFCTTTDEGSAWRTGATLSWLIHLGGEAADIARRTVVVATEVRPGTLEGFEVIKEQILSRCRAVVTIPFDAQFATGGALDLANIADATYEAYLDLAVELAHEFTGGGKPA